MIELTEQIRCRLVESFPVFRSHWTCRKHSLLVDRCDSRTQAAVFRLVWVHPDVCPAGSPVFNTYPPRIKGDRLLVVLIFTGKLRLVFLKTRKTWRMILHHKAQPFVQLYLSAKHFSFPFLEYLQLCSDLCMNDEVCVSLTDGYLGMWTCSVLSRRSLLI